MSVILILVSATNTRISAVAVNVPERYLYWSIPLNTSILRSTFDGGNVTSVLNDRNGNRFVYDVTVKLDYWYANKTCYLTENLS